MDYLNKYLNTQFTFYYGGYIHLGEFWNYKDINAVFSKCYFVTDGRLKITTDTEEIIGTKDTLIIVPAGLRHDVSCPFEDKATKYWMHFRLEAEGKSVFDLIHMPMKVTVKDPEYMGQLFEQILQYSDKQDMASYFQMQSSCYAILGYYFSEANVGIFASDQDKDRSMMRIATYIQEHLATPPSVADMAGMCHFNTSYFIRVFKEAFGCTPHRYIRRLQMEHAKNLLEHSDLSVSRVAGNLGFADVKHFTKLFKAYTHVSPTEYRKVNRRIFL